MALIAASVAVPASAELLYDNDTGGSVKIYGQFSPAYQSVDDGVSTKGTVVDNAHSNTRVGLWALQDYSDGEFSFNFESALGLRSSDAVSQTFTPDSMHWDKTKLRKVDFAFAHNSWGKFYAGQGSMAADGITGNDVSGNGMTTVNAVPDGAGSFTFRTSTGALSTISIGDVFSNLDGGRLGRVRYDSPSFSDFTISFSAGQNVLVDGNDDKFYDVALRYAHDFDGTEVSGGIAFLRRDQDGTYRDDTIGAVAVKIQSGWSFAVEGGSRKDDGSYGYVKVGYEANWLDWGSTSLALDYYDGSNFELAGRQSSSTGFGINQNIDDANTQVYLGFRKHTLKDPTVAYNDIDSVLFGARWKF